MQKSLGSGNEGDRIAYLGRVELSEEREREREQRHVEMGSSGGP